MIIQPFVGLGNILFNTKRKDVREQMSGNFRTFKQDNGSEEPVDYYNAFGMHLHYDESDCLEAIETFEPCVAKYDGMKLIQMSKEDVEHYFCKKGFVIEYNDAGFYIPEIGITIYIPFDKIEAVGVFRRGYFDE